MKRSSTTPPSKHDLAYRAEYARYLRLRLARLQDGDYGPVNPETEEGRLEALLSPLSLDRADSFLQRLRVRRMSFTACARSYYNHSKLALAAVTIRSYRSRRAHFWWRVALEEKLGDRLADRLDDRAVRWADAQAA